MPDSKLVNQKSLLAKLMATENITIYHEKISTAYWDTINRTLHCPIFEDCSPELYDLLMGHEIGHCLHTPKEGWHEAIEASCTKQHKHNMFCGSNTYHYFLNVCEDVRIEKLIKQRYPGLKTSFVKGYIELHERDFFGVKELDDINKLGLIDRINLHYKVGHILRIKFSSSEQKYLDRLDSATTFDEIRKISEDLYAQAKSDKTSKQIQTTSSLKKALGEVDDGEVDKDQEPTSVTDKHFRGVENKLCDENANATANATLPKPILNRIIIPLDAIVSEYFKDEGRFDNNCRVVAENCLKFFREKNMPLVRFLLQEFERKKNSTQYRREETRRVGQLDMRRLAEYRFTNDLFKKITELPKGKNHGLIEFLDMSGSMEGLSLYNAIEQLLTLSMFCDMAKIPYKAYGFSDITGSMESDFNMEPRDLVIGKLRLRTLLDSRASNVLKKDAMCVLSHLAIMSYRSEVSSRHKPSKQILDLMPNYRHRRDPSGPLILGGTPLVETILASRNIINQFKSNLNLDIVNVIYLTDGNGSTSVRMTRIVLDSLNKQSKQVELYTTFTDCSEVDLFITDTETKRIFFIPKNKKSNSIQSGLLKFVQELTECRHIGFYICDSYELKDQTTGYELRKEEGFDTYYYISNALMNSNESEEYVPNTNVFDQFNKEQTRLKTSRLILSQFAKEIGERL